MTDPGLLRIGNADRDEIVALLRRAADEGRLAPEEVAERTFRVTTALTYADLDALVADLPVTPPSLVLAARRQAAARPGWDPSHPLVISGGAGTERRSGRWELPPYIRLSGGVGAVRLNCLEATCLAPVIDVDVSGGAGSIRIVVPDGWGVDTDQVSRGIGSVRNRAQGVPVPGQPQLVLRGSMAMGSLRVRPATARERRRLLRRAGGPASVGWVAEHRELPNPNDLR
jgi:hypothetical protein